MWDWILWLGWYGVLGGLWLAWWRAHSKAARLERELTVMASSLRYAANQRPKERRHG